MTPPTSVTRIRMSATTPGRLWTRMGMCWKPCGTLPHWVWVRRRLATTSARDTICPPPWMRWVSGWTRWRPRFLSYPAVRVQRSRPTAGVQAYRKIDIAFNGAQATAAAIDGGIAVSEGDYTGAAIHATGSVLQGAHAGVRVAQVRSFSNKGRPYSATRATTPTSRDLSARAGTQLEFDFESPEASLESGAFEVGLYRDLKGKLPGYDAHHVGQQAIMKKSIPEYDPMNAPAILVPQAGHTRRTNVRVLSRSEDNIGNVRQLIARDVNELRRVYPSIPNARLQQLIDLNKQLYKPYMEK